MSCPLLKFSGGSADDYMGAAEYQYCVSLHSPLVSSRASYIDKPLLLIEPVNHQRGAPTARSTGRESDVECAAGTHCKHRRAIICGSEVLPLTWRATYSAANRLWRAAGVGHSDGSRGAGCVNHLIAELNRSRVQ